MKRYLGVLTKHLWLLVAMLLFSWANTSAQEEVRDTIRVYFRQNVSILDTLYVMESESLPAFVERIKPRFNDTLFTLKNVHVVEIVTVIVKMSVTIMMDVTVMMNQCFVY